MYLHYATIMSVKSLAMHARFGHPNNYSSDIVAAFVVARLLTTWSVFVCCSASFTL